MTEWRWYVVIGALALLLTSTTFLIKWTRRLCAKLLKLDAEYASNPEKYRTLGARYRFAIQAYGAEFWWVAFWLSVLCISTLISYVARNWWV